MRQVIDVDPNFIFAKDREGRFVLVNQAVADVFGTTVQDLIGKTDADFNANTQEVASFRRMDLKVMDTLQERFIAEERITDAQEGFAGCRRSNGPSSALTGKPPGCWGHLRILLNAGSPKKIAGEPTAVRHGDGPRVVSASGPSMLKPGISALDPVLPALLGIEVAASYPRDYWMKYIHPEDLERMLQTGGECSTRLRPEMKRVMCYCPKSSFAAVAAMAR